MRKYYNEATNTYIFKEDGEYIDLVIFKFDLYIDAKIKAHDIRANNIISYSITTNDINAADIITNNIYANNINTWDIKAYDIIANDIKARDITASNIDAHNIDYFAVCYAYNDIKCNSIEGMNKNSKHFTLYGKLEVKKWLNIIKKLYLLDYKITR